MSERKTHDLKCWQPYFDMVCLGQKKFEFRKNDRDFRVGDVLHLREYLPNIQAYTGESVDAEVTLLIDDAPGLPAGYVLMGILALESGPF